MRDQGGIFFFKLDITRKCTGGPRRRFRNLTEVRSSRFLVSICYQCDLSHQQVDVDLGHLAEVVSTGFLY